MPFPSEKFLPARPEKPRLAEPADDLSPRTLTEFVSDVRDAARFAADFSAELSRLPLPANLNGDQLFQVAQTLFEADVVRRGDLKNHIALRRLRQADRSIDLRESTLELSREKFQFDAAEVVLKHFAEIKTIHDSGSPHPEKLTALRRILFAALPDPNEDSDLPSPTEEDPAFS